MTALIKHIQLTVTGNGVGIVDIINDDDYSHRVHVHQEPVAREFAKGLSNFLRVPLTTTRKNKSL